MQLRCPPNLRIDDAVRDEVVYKLARDALEVLRSLHDGQRHTEGFEVIGKRPRVGLCPEPLAQRPRIGRWDVNGVACCYLNNRVWPHPTVEVIVQGDLRQGFDNDIGSRKNVLAALARRNLGKNKSTHEPMIPPMSGPISRADSPTPQAPSRASWARAKRAASLAERVKTGSPAFTASPGLTCRSIPAA
ncbi:unannotated protein [freshwater metagenome]|uniref:Unannotated protein n=1 Tax=freshwater metagenome TaxID=449393 RepID=A0A6J6FFR4_9ZZZZ